MFTKRQAVLLGIMAIILVVAVVLSCFSRRSDVKSDEMRVLTLWQIDSFEGGKGSRAQYLQDMADRYFEDKRAYVRVTALSADAARSNINSGLVPDMISYGAGFYGIESLVNTSDFISMCWCRGAYLLISVDENADFSDVSAENTVINIGKNNLSRACALFEGLSGAQSEASTSAYVSLINGKYKYLLGTQRDICRMQTRGTSFSVKVLTSFNDLYQNISILCGGEDYFYCRDFIAYLMANSAEVESLSMVSDGTASSGIFGEIERAEFEYELKSFVSQDYHNSLLDAIQKDDLNYLKNLLK